EAGRQPPARAAHVGDAERQVGAQLTVDGDVPLVRVGSLVGVERAIQNALAVPVVGADVRRLLEALGQPLIEVERRLDTTERARETRGVREAVLRDAAAPAWIVRLRVEDAPPT